MTVMTGFGAVGSTTIVPGAVPAGFALRNFGMWIFDVVRPLIIGCHLSGPVEAASNHTSFDHANTLGSIISEAVDVLKSRRRGRIASRRVTYV
jgi:hypothetical protein